VTALELVGPSVRLRAFAPDEEEMLFASAQTWQANIIQARGEGSVRERIRLRIIESGGWGERGLDFAIEAESRLIGGIQALGEYYSLPPDVYEMGIDIMDPVARGHGYGREAVSLLTRRLFEGDGAVRVQAITAASNEPMCRLLDGLGFVREGTMRRFDEGANGREDAVLFALIDDDYGVVAPTWTPTS
jgi:RimJ/RimL family protein N-acetyltransferase